MLNETTSKRYIAVQVIVLLCAILVWWHDDVLDSTVSWSRVYVDCGSDLPASMHAIQSGGNRLLAVAAGAAAIWWLLPVALSFRPLRNSKIESGWWSIGVLGMAVWTWALIGASKDAWERFASNLMDVGTLSQHEAGTYVSQLGDTALPDSDRVAAARKLRALGLLVQTGIIAPLDEHTVKQIRAIARDEERKEKIRFFAAWSLTVIELERRHHLDSVPVRTYLRDFTESETAINAGINAALSSDDADLREMAARYQKLPFFLRAPEPQQPAENQ